MKRNTKIQTIVVIVAFVIIGAIQGTRIDGMRDAERFYRWMLNAATQWRLEGTLIVEQSEGRGQLKDDELFQRVLAEAEEALPEIPATEDDDATESGEPRPKLIRAVQHEIDEPIWKFARSPQAADLRENFNAYLREGRLQSAGSQFSAESLYDEDLYQQGISGGFGTGLGSVFFGFRKVAANFLWMQVDKYWHAGMVHRMIPMMQTVVTLDPNFVDAYLLGAWHLAYNVTANMPETPEPQKEWNETYQRRLGRKETFYYIAMDFLRDGIKKNPRDYRLYFDLGYAIYEEKLEDHANAVLYLREATRQRHDKWVPRMLYHSLMHNGQHEEAIAGWRDYLSRVDPDSDVARRFITINQAYIAEKTSEEAYECASAARGFAEEKRAEAEQAETAGNAEKAAALEQEARQAEADAEEFAALHERERQEAVDLWTELHEQRGVPLAYARLLRMKAVDLANQGRYYEAIAQLELARWESDDVFDELSWMIIDYKQEAGIELDVTEELAVERRKEAEMYNPDLRNRDEHTVRRVDCEYVQTAEGETEDEPAVSGD